MVACSYVIEIYGWNKVYWKNDFLAGEVRREVCVSIVSFVSCSPLRALTGRVHLDSLGGRITYLHKYGSWVRVSQRQITDDVMGEMSIDKSVGKAPPHTFSTTATDRDEDDGPSSSSQVSSVTLRCHCQHILHTTYSASQVPPLSQVIIGGLDDNDNSNNKKAVSGIRCLVLQSNPCRNTTLVVVATLLLAVVVVGTLQHQVIPPFLSG